MNLIGIIHNGMIYNVTSVFLPQEYWCTGTPVLVDWVAMAMFYTAFEGFAFHFCIPVPVFVHDGVCANVELR